MNFLSLHLDSWLDARILADNLNGWTFRGQQDASWLLDTSLQRAGELIVLKEIEEQIIQEFQRRAHHFLQAPPSPENRIEWMALIQHFGGPTRLLDFTTSFYIASFFAVEKAVGDCAVWCVNRNALIKAVGPPGLQSTLPDGRPLSLDYAAGESGVKLHLPYWRIRHDMTLLTEHLLKNPQTFSHPQVFEVQPFRLNERLAVQQGLFLCSLSVEVPFMDSLAETFGLPPSAFTEKKTEAYDPLIHTTEETLNDTAVIKAVLPPTIHLDALQDLWNMNVTAAALFPGLDGFARSLHHFVRMDNLRRIKYAD